MFFFQSFFISHYFKNNNWLATIATVRNSNTVMQMVVVIIGRPEYDQLCELLCLVDRSSCVLKCVRTLPHNKMVETKNSHTQQIKQLPNPIEALNGLLTTVLERI